jgi:pentafunctional AROM polypeptide
MPDTLPPAPTPPIPRRCLRDTVIIAFGGGVIGDLSGYVAATYMRGVSIVQVPTTLLAMVDSAIGGKTAVDTPAGKNLIGAFHQPKRVYVDPSLLSTLPVREISNGMAEIIKAGAIANASLFDLCETQAEAILGKEVDAEAEVDADGNVTRLHVPASGSSSSSSSGRMAVKARSLDLPLLVEVIGAAVAVKTHVVTVDEKETGLRATLNYGHTVGHGIEALLQPSLLHGECVAIGMVKEAEIARALGHCDSALVGRIKRCCKAYGLPVTVPASVSGGKGLEEVMARIAVDKKNTKKAEADAEAASSGASSPASPASLSPAPSRPPSPPTGPRLAPRVQCVLLRRIGEVVAPPFTHSVPTPLLRRILSAAVSVSSSPSTAGVALPDTVTIRVPGSKSISNRALLLAGLSKGTTLIRGLLASDDTQVMLSCLSDMGATARFVPSRTGGPTRWRSRGREGPSRCRPRTRPQRAGSSTCTFRTPAPPRGSLRLSSASSPTPGPRRPPPPPPPSSPSRATRA